MPEILTESFCERCGTRYTFESTAPVKTKKLGRFKTLSKGLKNYVLSDENSLDEALSAARSDEERALASSQLEAFQSTFNFCMTCRQYTCANCWNAAETSCLTCAPLNGHSIAPSAFPAVAPLLPVEPLPFEASAWPTTDVSLQAATKSDASAPKRDRTAAPDAADGMARLRRARVDFAPAVTASAEPVAVEAVAVESVDVEPIVVEADDAVDAVEAALAEAALAEPPLAEPASAESVPSPTATPAVDETEADVADLADRLARLTEHPITPVVSADPNAEPPVRPRLDEAYLAVAPAGPAGEASTLPIDAEPSGPSDGADWAIAEAEASAEADPIGDDPAARLALTEATTLPANIDERAAAAARRTSDLFARLRPRTGIGVELEAFGTTSDAEPAADQPEPDESMPTEASPEAGGRVDEITHEAKIVDAPEAVVFSEPELAELAASAEAVVFAEPEPEPAVASQDLALLEPDVFEAPEGVDDAEPAVAEATEPVVAEMPDEPEIADALLVAEPGPEPEVVEASEFFAFLEPQIVEAPEAVADFVEPEVETFAVADFVEPEVETFAVAAPEVETLDAFVDVSEPVPAEPWPEASDQALPTDLLALIGPAIEARPEPDIEVAAETVEATPETVEAAEIPEEAEPDAAVAAAAEVTSPAVEPQAEPVRADVVEQPTWRIVAPDANAAPTNGHTPPPEPAAPPVAAPAITPQPAAEPQWPAPQQSSVSEDEIPFILSRRTADSPEGLWAASARGVVDPPKGAPVAAVQTCVSCGLSLSATARFCRRCGSRQD